MKRNISLLFIIPLITFTGTACQKFVDVKPGSNIIEKDNVFSTDVTAVSAVNGMYAQLYNAGFAKGYVSNIPALCGLSADELHHYDPLDMVHTPFEKNAVSSTNGPVEALWTQIYEAVYVANSGIEGLQASTSLTEAIRNQLTGEMYFIRAFAHFYAASLFGDVPLVLTADYRQNAVATRTPAAKVYAQVISDLLMAEGLMGDAYPSEERARPNKAAARALLARVYLYTGDWAGAEQKADLVIGDSRYRLLQEAEFDQVFLRSSEEAIWQLMPYDAGGNTFEAATFLLLLTGGPNPERPYSLQEAFVNAFEPGDLRKARWINKTNVFYYPYKYKLETANDLQEFSMVLRLAEVYLIRAEARAHTGKLSGAGSAQEDINAIRQRALLPPISVTTEAQAMAAIEKERRMELFTEWGHRWMDLKRWKRADAVLAPLKGNTWQPNDTLYPLPQKEMQNNPFLKPQNPGYSN